MTFVKVSGEDEIVLDNTDLNTLFAGVIDADTASAATKKLYDHENTTGSIVLKDYVTKDPKDLGISINGTDIDDIKFDPIVSKDGKKVTGTRLGESAKSTEANETFDLKAGNDEIVFSTLGYGFDNVALNTEGEMNLVFKDFNGNNVDMYTNGDHHYVDYAKSVNNKDLVMATLTQYKVVLSDKNAPATHYNFVLTNVGADYVWQDTTTTPGSVYTLTTDDMETIYNNGAMDGVVEIKTGVTVKFVAGDTDTVEQWIYDSDTDTYKKLADKGNTVAGVKDVFANAEEISKSCR